jgi:hypothetical protein
MPAPLSAIDAISPAFNQTKCHLLQPFRLQFWARMAVVAMTTGEFAFPGSWGGWSHWFPSPQRRRLSGVFAGLPKAIWERMAHFWPLLVVVAVLTVILAAMWIYMACVFRFILFDSVVRGECDLKTGWPLWKPQGRSYLFWKIALWLVTAAVAAVLVGVPFLWAAATGTLRDARSHIPLLILGGGTLLILMVAFLLGVAVVSLLAQDFVIPIMAVERVGVLEGWSRFFPMLRREKKPYVGYVLMKIVLGVGTAIFFGIASLLTVLLLMIPLGIFGLGIFLAARAAGLGFNYYTFSAGVILAGGAISGIIYALSIVSTPAMVFFQSYANHFLGSRYPALGARVFPAPPRPEAAPSPTA